MARLVAERDDVVPLLGEVFRRYGFEGASIARIGDYTRLGKGSLYHFFPRGKDEMAEAVLAHVSNWFETQIFLPLQESPPNEAIERMFEGVDDYFRSGQRICLVGAFALEETRDRFSEPIRDYFSRWLTTLASALERGGMEPAEAGRRASEVVAGIQGAIVLARALDDNQRFSDVIRGLAGSCRL